MAAFGRRISGDWDRWRFPPAWARDIWRSAGVSRARGRAQAASSIARVAGASRSGIGTAVCDYSDSTNRWVIEQRVSDRGVRQRAERYPVVLFHTTMDWMT